ncbi:MAG: neutral zinc metallopeptidase [Actinoplanes sp.]
MKRFVVALITLLLLGGCVRTVKGFAVAQIWSPDRVAGLPITDGDSGLRAGGPDARVSVAGSDGGGIDRLAGNAVDDVQAFWAKEFPKAFDKKYRPVENLISYDSGGPGTPVCGADSAGLVNAFYCGGDDSIAWDRGQLLPSLAADFGEISVVTVLAHELGHAVQSRLGAGDASSIVKEQQADCYTGSYLRRVAEGDSPRFQVSTGAGLNQVLSTMFFIRDGSGITVDDPSAHGNAFDRVSAFQLGFGDGAGRCARIDDAEVRRRVTQESRATPQDHTNRQGQDGQESRATPQDHTNRQGQDGQESQVAPQRDPGDAGNLDIGDPGSLTALEATLRTTFEPARPEFTEQTGCGDGPAVYCARLGTVELDLPSLRLIGAPPRPGGGGGLGDFAAFAEVASRYSLAYQNGAGLPLEGLGTAQRTACLTGVWAAAIVAERGRELQLSPGDLDEAVAELLAADSRIAADVRGAVVPSGFARISAFRDGFSGNASDAGTSNGRTTNNDASDTGTTNGRTTNNDASDTGTSNGRTTNDGASGCTRLYP